MEEENALVLECQKVVRAEGLSNFHCVITRVSG
jgi:hypothetical protein